MEEIAQVVRVIEGGGAEVEIRRHTVCNECGGCGHGHSANTRFEVDNPIEAREGETVILEMATKNLLMAVLLIYLLPLVDLIIGYLLGDWVNTTYHLFKGELFSIFCGLLFLALTFVFVRQYDKRAGLHSGFKPRITRVIDRDY